MSNWGISPNASEKEKIKADYADILHGMNSTGAITYDVYSDLFDDGMELFDRMYEQGKADAADVVEVKRGLWIAQDSSYTRFMCSECNSVNHHIRWDFCPLCGASMRERRTNDGNKENL